ncbi:hypothetical protein ACHAWF_011076 [Thalassiosira exigua]
MPDADIAWHVLRSCAGNGLLCQSLSAGMFQNRPTNPKQSAAARTLSMLRYFEATFSSSSDSDEAAAPEPDSCGGDGARTASTILASTPSCVTLWRTASGGTPIFSIFRYFDATFSSSGDRAVAATVSGADGPASDSDGASSAFDPLPSAASIVAASTPSMRILCDTASGGMPTFNMLRNFAAAFSSMAAAPAPFPGGAALSFDEPGPNDTSTSSSSPRGERHVSLSFNARQNSRQTSGLSNVRGVRPEACAKFAPVASTFNVKARISERRQYHAIVAFRPFVAAVTTASFPTMTIRSGSPWRAFRGKVDIDPSGKISAGGASRSTTSPARHGRGGPDALGVATAKLRPEDDDDEEWDAAASDDEPPDATLFHDPLACMPGSDVGTTGRSSPVERMLGVVGVMDSRFLGVDLNWTLAHGADAFSSSGVEGGVIRGFFRGVGTRRRTTSSPPETPPGRSPGGVNAAPWSSSQSESCFSFRLRCFFFRASIQESFCFDADSGLAPPRGEPPPLRLFDRLTLRNLTPDKTPLLPPWSDCSGAAAAGLDGVRNDRPPSWAPLCTC